MRNAFTILPFCCKSYCADLTQTNKITFIHRHPEFPDPKEEARKKDWPTWIRTLVQIETVGEAGQLLHAALLHLLPA
jgi:hypothetical protein